VLLNLCLTAALCRREPQQSRCSHRI
jgi:hypothetical protein